MAAREMNTKEVVRWLNELETRYTRIKRIALIASVVAIVALVLPALPTRISPWARERIEVFELRTPGAPNTGELTMSVTEGSDPRLAMINTNRQTNARLEIADGSPSMYLHDESGNNVRLRLAQWIKWSGKDDARSSLVDETRFNGLTLSTRRGKAMLGSDDALLSLELESPEHGAIRMWSGHRHVEDETGAHPERLEATRDPGSALVLLDCAGTPRVSMSLVDAPGESHLNDRGEARPEAAVPTLALHDENGKTRAILRVTAVPPPAEGDVDPRHAQSVPSLVLLDHHDRERVILGLDATGAATLSFLDENGNVVRKLP
jgi:hypothetical protein